MTPARPLCIGAAIAAGTTITIITAGAIVTTVGAIMAGVIVITAGAIATTAGATVITVGAIATTGKAASPDAFEDRFSDPGRVGINLVGRLE